ncbi:sulfurtransferase TusA family protein [Oceanicola sp. S124]|uniref:sulfurtransferase TusA family protein n=1 Tax=Oceanicola sp. S124 TaxID=1042378 RepID=UPI0002557E66|nr:sulfurtransferase TusA family protein [Oceanicola sp. S124]
MDELTEIDARGLRCPLPVLRAQKALRALPSGARLRVLADDPMARIDMPHFCAEAGHALLEAEENGGALTFLIRRG